MQLNELLYVHLMYNDGRIGYYHVVKTDLIPFVRAQYKLHCNPGKNPHSGAECTKVTQIFAYEMGTASVEKYWWSSPSLELDSEGARVLSMGAPYRHFDFLPSFRRRGINPYRR